MGGNGGTNENERPSAVIIPVTTEASQTTNAPAGAATDTAAAAPARRLPRPSRLVVLLTVLGLVVAGVGAYAVLDWREQRDERNQARELAAQEAAQRDVRPALDDYRLPDSIRTQDCGLFGFRCGSTELEQTAAVEAVAASLEARGVEVEDVECETGRPPTDTACRAGVLFRGQFVGNVEAGRKDVAYRVFGQPTSVLINIYDPAQAVITESTTAAMTAAERRAVKLPAELDAALRCSAETAGGCEAYRGRLSVEDRQDFWAETGRDLVRLGWPRVGGQCDPAQPKQKCTVDADRRTKDGRRVHLLVVIGADSALASLTATGRVPA